MSAASPLRDRVLALHPTMPNQCVRLRRDRYEAFRTGIVNALRERGPLTLEALIETAADSSDTGLCTPSWYVRTVKLDLEARGVVERLPHSRPHQVRLA